MSMPLFPPGGMGGVAIDATGRVTAPPIGAGAYASRPLTEGAIDSLKNNCLGSGTKVPEEVAAVKLALEAAIAEREATLCKRLCPPVVVALLADPGLALIDAGVALPLVGALYPHVLADEWKGRVDLINSWRRARLSLRMLSRFEMDTGATGLSAYKLWEESQRSIIAETEAGNSKEPELRDAIVDDDALLNQVVVHMHSHRKPPHTQGQG
jgi:hypothetical protein